MAVALKQMEVWLVPSVVPLQGVETHLVHDIGEIVQVRKACGRRAVRVEAKDKETDAILKGKVHAGGRSVALGEVFEHEFIAEFNEKTRRWAPDMIWVEVDGYENTEVRYEVAVEQAGGRRSSK